jgi:hypothetical protein
LRHKDERTKDNINILKEKKAPPPGFEPGIPKGPVFKTGAIPDYAIVANECK